MLFGRNLLFWCMQSMYDVLMYVLMYLEAEWVIYFSQEIEYVIIKSHKKKTCIQIWLPLSHTRVSLFNFVSSVLYLRQNWAWNWNKTDWNVLSISSWSKTVQSKQKLIQLPNKNNVFLNAFKNKVFLKQKMLHSHLVENSEVNIYVYIYINSISLLFKKIIFKEPLLFYFFFIFFSNWATV